MSRKKVIPVPRKEDFIYEHVPNVETSECEFGDHIYITCRCDWKSKNKEDGTYEYMTHLKEKIVEVYGGDVLPFEYPDLGYSEINTGAVRLPKASVR